METRREYAPLVVKLLPTWLTSTAKKKFHMGYEYSLPESSGGARGVPESDAQASYFI